jgi:hypothetical protein
VVSGTVVGMIGYGVFSLLSRGHDAAVDISHNTAVTLPAGIWGDTRLQLFYRDDWSSCKL